MALQDFFGSSTGHPPGIEPYAPFGPEGLIWFANNIMRVAIYGSMLVALINLVVSGIQYIGSSGNPEVLKSASSRIWISILGLVVAGGSLVIAGVLGLIFFGSPTAIIAPTIYGP
jgi:hypothetical protein